MIHTPDSYIEREGESDPEYWAESSEETPPTRELQSEEISGTVQAPFINWTPCEDCGSPLCHGGCQ